MAMGTSTSHMTTRRRSPSLSGTPAASEATPVAKGLTVEAMIPVPAPSRMIPAPTMRSKPMARVRATRRT